MDKDLESEFGALVVTLSHFREIAKTINPAWPRILEVKLRHPYDEITKDVADRALLGHSLNLNSLCLAGELSDSEAKKVFEVILSAWHDALLVVEINRMVARMKELARPTQSKATRVVEVKPRFTYAPSSRLDIIA